MAVEKKWKKVVLSSGNPNRYKYLVKVLGIKLASFIKNPIMLYVHKRADGVVVKFPIGRWEEIGVENGQLTARPFFDLKDDMGSEVARRWEEGFLFASSIRHTFDKITDDPSELKIGADYAVIECEILEASIVDIPGDADAVIQSAALNFEVTERMAFLAENTPLSIVPQLTKSEIVNPKLTDMNQSEFAVSLGLSADATKEQIAAKIAALNQANVDGILSLGRRKGVVTDDNIATMRTNVTSNTDGMRLAFEAMPDKVEVSTTKATPQPTQTLAAALAAVSSQAAAPSVPNERDGWSLLDWRKNDPEGLLVFEKTHPLQFNAMVDGLVKKGAVLRHLDNDKQA